MEQTKKRSSRTTGEQHKIMLDFFHTNKGLAEGKFASINGRQEASQKWEELASLLNEVRGAEKSALQWQVSWRDLKSRTSIKARERRKEMAKTAGNPQTLPALTELDMGVLGIVGHNYSEGSSICPETLPEEEHLQILLEIGNTDALYEIPTICCSIGDEAIGAVGGIQDEENWPVEELDLTADEPPQQKKANVVCKKRVAKRTQMDSAREQFAIIAKKQADAIMIQAESAKQQANASKQVAEAALCKQYLRSNCICSGEIGELFRAKKLKPSLMNELIN